MRTALAALLFAAAGATAATAQDAPKPFNGLYVGASGGYDIRSNDVGEQLTFDRNGSGTFNQQVTTAAGANAFSPGFCGGRAVSALAIDGCTRDPDGASYYGRVGIDRQRGHLVVGLLGEFGKSEVKDFASGFSTTPASYTFERSLNYEASARLRAGYALGDGLFYVTGGVGYADIRHRFTTTNTANAFAGTGNSRKAGYVVGLGVEKYLTKHITFGVEYTYHDYEDRNYQVRVTQGTAAATNPFVLAPNTAGTTIRRSDTDFNWNSLRATVGFHF